MKVIKLSPLTMSVSFASFSLSLSHYTLSSSSSTSSSLLFHYLPQVLNDRPLNISACQPPFTVVSSGPTLFGSHFSDIKLSASVRCNKKALMAIKEAKHNRKFIFSILGSDLFVLLVLILVEFLVDINALEDID